MKIEDLIPVALGAAIIYFIWPKKKAGAPPGTSVAPGYPATVRPTTSTLSPMAQRAENATAPDQADIADETALYQQQAQMSPDDLAQSILSQGMNGYDDGGMGPAFAGGWWR